MRNWLFMSSPIIRPQLPVILDAFSFMHRIDECWNCFVLSMALASPLGMSTSRLDWSQDLIKSLETSTQVMGELVKRGIWLRWPILFGLLLYFDTLCIRPYARDCVSHWEKWNLSPPNTISLSVRLTCFSFCYQQKVIILFLLVPLFTARYLYPMLRRSVICFWGGVSGGSRNQTRKIYVRRPRCRLPGCCRPILTHGLL